MPCYGESADYTAGYNAGERAARHRFRHNSDVADMLCRVLKGPYSTYLPEDIQQWWNEHLEQDILKKKHKQIMAWEQQKLEIQRAALERDKLNIVPEQEGISQSKTACKPKGFLRLTQDQLAFLWRVVQGHSHLRSASIADAISTLTMAGEIP